MFVAETSTCPFIVRRRTVQPRSRTPYDWSRSGAHPATAAWSRGSLRGRTATPSRRSSATRIVGAARRAGAGTGTGGRRSAFSCAWKRAPHRPRVTTCSRPVLWRRIFRDRCGPYLCLHPALLRAPVDLDLVRHGRHRRRRAAPPPPGRPVPVRAARAAGRRPSSLFRAFAEGERIGVHCGRTWHVIRVRGGRLDLLHHTDDERRRERALERTRRRDHRLLRGRMPSWHDRAPRIGITEAAARAPARSVATHAARRRQGGARAARRGPGPGVPRRAGPDPPAPACTSSSTPSCCPGCSTRAWT